MSTAKEHAPQPPKTADDLMALQDDGFRYELVRGEIVKTAPAGGRHGNVANSVAFLLTSHVRAAKLGHVFIAECGFVLSRNPDTVRAPDVAFVARERVERGVPKGYFAGAPDLAVEVMSPSDKPDDVQDKVLAYLAAGTRMVWVLYPDTQTVLVWRSPASIRLVRGDEIVSGEDVVSGFRCRAGEFFEG